MALKGDRYEFQTDISFFLNEVAERGGMLCMSTGGSGAAMDQSQALATYPATASGKVPLGILLNDMVNIDITRQRLNQYRDEVQKGSKVTVLRKGYVLTNYIEGTTPSAGDPVYAAHSGYMSKTDIVGNGTMSVVGMWLSSVDQDGYAKCEINLPASKR